MIGRSKRLRVFVFLITLKFLLASVRLLSVDVSRPRLFFYDIPRSLDFRHSFGQKKLIFLFFFFSTNIQQNVTILDHGLINWLSSCRSQKWNGIWFSIAIHLKDFYTYKMEKNALSKCVLIGAFRFNSLFVSRLDDRRRLPVPEQHHLRVGPVRTAKNGPGCRYVPPVSVHQV